MKENIKKIIEQYQLKINPIIKKYIQNKTLLDVGCGNGLNSFFFIKNHQSKVTLSDIEDIRELESKSFKFFRASIDSLPFKKKEFEVTFVQYVLHHLSNKINIEKAFSELRRVSQKIILVEEIATRKTNLEKAKKFDEEINNLIHPSIKMPIYKYYTDSELKDIFIKNNLKLLKERVLDKEKEKEGFLLRKIYILETK